MIRFNPRPTSCECCGAEIPDDKWKSSKYEAYYPLWTKKEDSCGLTIKYITLCDECAIALKTEGYICD